MRVAIVIVILILQNLGSIAQPGAWGSDLIFSFRKPVKHLKVYWHRSYDSKKIQLKPDENSRYKVISSKSPIGGFPNGHIEAVLFKDTMQVHYPYIESDKNIVLESIPFKKGKYIIPYVVYYVHSLTKPEYRKELKPNLEGDWADFEVNSPPLRNAIARRVEVFSSNDFHSYLPLVGCDRTGLFSYHPSFLSYYFLDEQFASKIIGSNVTSNSGGKFYFFGTVVDSDIFFLVKEHGGKVEYGRIEVPIVRDNVQQKKDSCSGGLLFPNLDEPISFGVYSFHRKNFEPYVLGHYSGIKSCNEYFGTEKTIWGIFKIYIEKPDERTLSEIKEEHSADNKLFDISDHK